MPEDPILNASPPPLPPRRRSCLVPALIALVLALLIGACLWWWFNRPIEPVELTARESQVVSAKIEALEAVEPEPQYEKGTSEIVLTSRELNGLFHQNTGLGDKVRFELATDAVHARVETDLDPGLPVIGGLKLKGRARFFIRSENHRPTLALDDVTVWGVSMPNDWLAGLKGRDLLADILGGETSAGIGGVQELRIEPNQLILRLAE